jgi:hypothetical protein
VCRIAAFAGRPIGGWKRPQSLRADVKSSRQARQFLPTGRKSAGGIPANAAIFLNQKESIFYINPLLRE